MSTQLKIWTRLATNRFPLLGHCPSIVFSLLPSLPLYAKSPMKFVNFRNQIAIPSSTPPERGVVSDFLISKCGLTEEEVTKCFRHYNPLLSVKSTQNMEETLELLHCCGLTTSAQFRSVVLYNPMILCLRCDSLKPKFSFLRTVIKEEDISKIVVRDARILNVREDKLKSRASLFLRSGFDGKTLAHLLARRPRLLMISEEKNNVGL